MRTDLILRALIGALAALILSLGAALAQGDAGPWEQWDREAANAEQIIERGEVSRDGLIQVRARLEAQSSAAGDLSRDAAAAIARLQAQLDALGPVPENGGEPEDVASLRAELTAAVSTARARQGRAERVATRAEDLRSRLAALDQRRFLSQIETLGPSPVNPSNWTAARTFAADAWTRIRREVGRSLEAPGTRQLAIQRLPLAALAVLAALFIAFGVRWCAVGALLQRAQSASRRQSRLLFGVGAAAARLIVLAAAAALLFYGLGSTGLFGALGEATLIAMSRAVLTIIVAYAVAAALFSPKAAGLRPYHLEDEQAARGFLYAMLLGAAMAVEYFFRRVGEAANAEAAAIAPFSFAAILLGGVSLYQLAQVARPFVNRAVEHGELALGAQTLRFIRRAAVVVAVLAPILALIGYAFAARFLFFPTVRSLAALAVIVMVYFVIREAVENYLADKNEEGGDRLRLIPVFAGFLLFCLAVPVLALIWGATWADIVSDYNRLVAGFQIGDVSLSPMDFVTFALVFVIGYTLTRAAQRVMKNSVLPKTGMSAGGANALTSGTGYVGIFLAAIAAITAAGGQAKAVACDVTDLAA
ncbi:MAG: DUF3772 domain-containing protein, partial [Pseudomonadota bacterium]